MRAVFVTMLFGPSCCYRPQFFVAKVIFLHLFVILFTGGGGFCLNACWDTTPPDQIPPRIRHHHPPSDQTPPGSDTTTTPRIRHPPRSDPPPGSDTTPPPDQTHTPQDQADPPDQTPPPPGSRLQHTVYERPVRILLECILVCHISCIIARIKSIIATEK